MKNDIVMGIVEHWKLNISPRKPQRAIFLGISSYIIRINYIAKADGAGKESYFLYNGHGDVMQTVDESGTV